jgi:polyisoprenoid-binding protein YceI
MEVCSMVNQSALTREIAGRELPPPGRWTIDPAHSDIQFVVRHLMIAKVRGRFREFSGAILVGESPEDSFAEATIDVASIDTRDPARDEHLRSPEFLDIERYPTIRFRTTEVRAGEVDDWRVTGALTIRDVTNPVTLDVEFGGTALDPWGNLRAGFIASTEIDRGDFGISWNQALEAGGYLVGKTVRIEIEVEAVREPDAAESKRAPE